MTRRLLLIALVVLICAGSLWGQSSQRTSLVELFTSTTCYYCPRAETWINGNMAALEASNTAVEIAWHVWWPAAGDPFYDANTVPAHTRVTLYGVSGTPTLLIDGAEDAGDTTRWTANMTAAADVPAPLQLTIDQTDFTHARVRVQVTGIADIYDNPGLFLVITEDNIHYGGSLYNGVFREVAPESHGLALALPTGLDTTFIIDYTIGSGWNGAECKMIAYVQDLNTHVVLNATWAPLSIPGYFMSMTAPLHRAILAATDSIHFRTLIRNIGTNDDNIRINLAPTALLPTSWVTREEIDGEVSAFPMTLGLIAGDSSTIAIACRPNAPGEGNWHLAIHSESDSSQSYATNLQVWNRPDVLLLEDDLGQGLNNTYRQSFSPMLVRAEWDLVSDGLTPDITQDVTQVPVTVRFTGHDSMNTILSTEIAPMRRYAQAGGHIAIFGEGIPINLSTLPAFHTVLHLTYTGDYAGTPTLTGEPGTAFAGVTVSLNGPGSAVTALRFPKMGTTDTTLAKVLFRWADGSPAAYSIPYSTPSVTGHIAIFGFGLESVDGSAARRNLGNQLMAYFTGTSDVALLAGPKAIPIYPNPVRNGLVHLPSTGSVTIFNAAGHEVAMIAGSSNGMVNMASLVSGTYWLRAENGTTYGPVVLIGK